LISIVEDDSSVREAAVSLLRSNGFVAESFSSAAEFLSSAGAREPGCLILDLRLPGMNGLELQHRLAVEGRHIPIVFITAHRNPEAQAQAMRAGAIAFLSKPFSEEALLGSIRLALENPTETNQTK